MARPARAEAILADAVQRMAAHGRLSSRVTIRRGARININDRWRIARVLPPDMRFEKSLGEQLAWVEEACRKVRELGRQGMWTYDANWLLGLMQVRLALRWIRRFEGGTSC